MRTRRWQRWTARAVLVVFTAASVACGGSNDAPTTATAAPTAPQVAQAPPAEPPPPPAPPPPAPPQPAPSPTLPAQPPEQLSKDELRELVAPVALYPDVVLASLLPATTNPDQIHDAAVYIGDSQQVERVPEDATWDGSVVGLLQFPDVLRWLDENPAWTDQMGQAVTYQQGDVLEAIQDYRRLVQNAGNLKSNQYQTVRSARNNIYIEPARPDIVYVPSYDPVVATQPQPAVATPGINPWIAFGGGAVVGALGAWALYSIFDDDDEHHYYGGGGRGGWRRIRRYDNYYYARGRRPRPVDWEPRPRQYRARAQDWNRPRRLEHRAAAATRPVRSAPLRPPSARPGQVRRQDQRLQRQQNQVQRQERKQEQRQQTQQRKQEQRRQQQGRRQSQQLQRQERKQQQRSQQRQQGQQRQQRQGQRRENQQQQRQERRENRQMQQPQRQENRQQQQEQRRESRMQQQQQRQERQAERRETRQERRQQNQSGNNKKKRNQSQ